MQINALDKPAGDPLVTVIVATYNVAGKLPECLDSIATQTYPNRELIVIDGGSTDGTVDVIRAHQTIITHWRSEPDSGMYDAWDKALEIARGEYIAFLGADDRWHSTLSLEKLVQSAVENNLPDLVSAKLVVIDETTGNHLVVKGAPWNFQRLRSNMILAHPGMLHNRRLFKKHGVFSRDYRISSDYDFLLRLPASTTSAFLDEVVTDVGAGGGSRQDIRRVLKETLQIQVRHQIGWPNALLNYIIAYMKFIARRLLRRKY